MQRLCITSHDFPSFDVIAFTETCEIMPIRVCKIIYCTLLVFIDMNKTHSTTISSVTEDGDGEVRGNAYFVWTHNISKQVS